MEMEQLKCWGDTDRVVWHKCDLQDLRHVDRTAKKLKDEEKRIDAVRGQGIIKRSSLIMSPLARPPMLALGSTSTNSPTTV